MTEPAAPSKRLGWLRLWPIGLIAAGIGAAWAFGLFDYLSLDTLRDQQATLRALVEDHFVLALAGFVAVYALATFFMIPGALWITIAGGFLFGLGIGSAATILGATLGATALFLAARTSFGGYLRKIAGGQVEKVQGEFEKSPLAYLFAMRFFPGVPFPVANILPALLGAKLRDFLISTVFGIIPGVLAYSWVGAGLGATFARGEDPDLASVFRNLLPAALALVAVSLLPVLWKKFAARGVVTPPKV
jgi:uncharacterized membrane protein YdjX (TVP38/TMEM64 family)